MPQLLVLGFLRSQLVGLPRLYSKFLAPSQQIAFAQLYPLGQLLVLPPQSLCFLLALLQLHIHGLQPTLELLVLAANNLALIAQTVLLVFKSTDLML
jgi:hypothetical protein